MGATSVDFRDLAVSTRHDRCMLALGKECARMQWTRQTTYLQSQATQNILNYRHSAVISDHVHVLSGHGRRLVWATRLKEAVEWEKGKMKRKRFCQRQEGTGDGINTEIRSHDDLERNTRQIRQSGAIMRLNELLSG